MKTGEIKSIFYILPKSDRYKLRSTTNLEDAKAWKRFYKQGRVINITKYFYETLPDCMKIK